MFSVNAFLRYFLEIRGLAMIQSVCHGANLFAAAQVRSYVN
jgi:putative intracellular protease/amidase